MQRIEQNIIVESCVVSAGDSAQHIKLIVGDSPEVSCQLSLSQARWLAMSLVEQVHRLEVANSMRETNPQTRVARIGRQSAMLLNASRTA